MTGEDGVLACFLRCGVGEDLASVDDVEGDAVLVEPGARTAPLAGEVKAVAPVGWRLFLFRFFLAEDARVDFGLGERRRFRRQEQQQRQRVHQTPAMKPAKMATTSMGKIHRDAMSSRCAATCFPFESRMNEMNVCASVSSSSR